MNKNNVKKNYKIKENIIMDYSTSFFNKNIEDVTKEIADLIKYEESRQNDKIILIPSESIAPLPVRLALASPFTNIYAEGYPSRDLIFEDDESILDLERIFSYYRRYSNRRFYRGCDFVDIIETLAQRSAAKLFASPKYHPEDIFANVQPLSGAAANTAVYDAFVKTGETVMGMSLMHGGHLTHGSEFNRSGKSYHIVAYEVDPKTEKLNYDKIYDLAQQYKPRMIIAGYTSYPWAPDWKKFREIADSVNAILFADVSHPAGLIVAGVYPNPIDYADVITFTTHKTLFGPRGAVILTTNPDYAEMIDQAVFPGEQGGPHVNKFAAMAVAFKIAQSKEFKETQKRIVENAKYLSSRIEKNGIRLAYGGTDTHLFLLDLKSISAKSGYTLRGEIAVRILDLCGIVANKNTIPGDLVTPEATGIRMGTPWITQRGITKNDLDKLADIISHILKNIDPFEYIGLTGTLPRGKINRKIISESINKIKTIARNLTSERNKSENSKKEYLIYGRKDIEPTKDYGEKSVIIAKGGRTLQMLEESSTAHIVDIDTDKYKETLFFDENNRLIAHAEVVKIGENEEFALIVNPEDKYELYEWLNGLSDGYIKFNDKDIFMKIKGPSIIKDFSDIDKDLQEKIIKRLKSLKIPEDRFSKVKPGENIQEIYKKYPEYFELSKPYFIGHEEIDIAFSHNKKEFKFQENEGKSSKPSVLFEEHKKLGAIMVDFAGWKMPVRYESIIEEHKTVREKAGLFDISHMGVFEISGKNSTIFLDTVTTNCVSRLRPGQSQYNYLLDPDGNVIDDIMVYRTSRDNYIVVVNAANEEKDFSWLTGINDGKFIIDKEYPHKNILDKVEISNLKTPEAGEKAKINIALQGPESINILKGLISSERERVIFLKTKKTEFVELNLAGINCIVSRTGYTGEEIGYEILVHPELAPELWNIILEEGKKFGLKPIGLGARDSLRTEAGLPLYGHELAGPLNISPVEAGFAPYIKLHKPFFIGRSKIKEKILNQKLTIVRYQLQEKGVKMVKPGDLVASKKNYQIIGRVTSNAVNGDGLQVGLALIEKRAANVGSKIALIPMPLNKGNSVLDLEKLNNGTRFPVPTEAIIVQRFLNRE